MVQPLGTGGGTRRDPYTHLVGGVRAGARWRAGGSAARMRGLGAVGLRVRRPVRARVSLHRGPRGSLRDRRVRRGEPVPGGETLRAPPALHRDPPARGRMGAQRAVRHLRLRPLRPGWIVRRRGLHGRAGVRPRAAPAARSPPGSARAGSGRGEHGAGAAGRRRNARGGARPSDLAGPAEALPPSRSAAPSEPHLSGAGGLYDERAGRLAGCADPPGRSPPPPHAKSDCETLSTRTGAQHEP